MLKVEWAVVYEYSGTTNYGIAQSHDTETRRELKGIIESHSFVIAGDFNVIIIRLSVFCNSLLSFMIMSDFIISVLL